MGSHKNSGARDARAKCSCGSLLRLRSESQKAVTLACIDLGDICVDLREEVGESRCWRNPSISVVN